MILAVREVSSKVKARYIHRLIFTFCTFERGSFIFNYGYKILSLPISMVSVSLMFAQVFTAYCGIGALWTLVWFCRFMFLFYVYCKVNFFIQSYVTLCACDQEFLILFVEINFQRGISVLRPIIYFPSRIG